MITARSKMRPADLAERIFEIIVQVQNFEPQRLYAIIRANRPALDFWQIPKSARE